MASHDIASLFIESDMMDRRVVSEAQLKNRTDAFLKVWHRGDWPPPVESRWSLYGLRSRR